MRKLVLGVAVLSVCLSLAACGDIVPASSDAATDAQETDAVEDICAKSELSVDEFFTCVSRTICNFYSDCVGSTTSYLDCDNLPISIFDSLTPPEANVLIASATAANRLQWNPTGAKQCIDMLQSRQCAVFKNDSDVFAACDTVTGMVADGALCQHDLECSTAGAQCVQRTGTPGSQCTDYMCQPPVSAGTMCTGGNFCGVGDHCVARFQGADISFCATGAAGAQCDSDGDCDLGLYCNGGLNDRTAAGLCTASKQAGATCKTDEECMGELACVGNFGAVNGICRDVRQPDAVCDTNNFTAMCYGNQACETQAANMTGTCKAAPQLGEPCGVVSGSADFCGFFLACENSLCREPGAVGETCTQSNLFGGFTNVNGCNLGLFCDIDITGGSSGTCREPQANGATCSRDSNCESRFCSPNTPQTCQQYPTCSF
ncbi:MAG: hypothetical protein F9K40_10930 [Kofleriaceae bacterium]|nr:MAG: hypothetical protein F9K40_10930 [Kofleriaceae bacterium]MBZ0236064.1 hypothetical protein [Kofleriaceae bacterium]